MGAQVMGNSMSSSAGHGMTTEQTLGSSLRASKKNVECHSEERRHEESTHTRREISRLHAGLAPMESGELRGVYPERSRRAQKDMV